MKKTLFLSTLSLMFTSTTIAQQGLYVQADVGYAQVKTERDAAKGFSPRLSVGYNFGQFRLAADYTWYKDYKGTDKRQYIANDLTKKEYTYKYDNSFNSFGVSAIYDFQLHNIALKPYAGVRLAINQWKTEHDLKNQDTQKYAKLDKTKLGYGVLLGASYPLMPHLDVELGYRFNYWGKMSAIKIKTHELSTGLRYTF